MCEKNTYLWSTCTMLQEHLNAVMMMNVHEELTDSLDLKSIPNKFCVRDDSRKTKIPKLWNTINGKFLD